MPATLDLERPHSGTPDNAWRTAIWLTLAAVSMMFMGLTSAYVVSQGLEPAWKQVHMRPLIRIDTAILLLSSITMEIARRTRAFQALAATLSLGLLFLTGQIGVFRQLAHEGYYLSTGRQSAFYYVLTGLHGLHVLGGILALTWLLRGPRPYMRLEVTTVYWHFMSVLWLYLLVVFFA